MEDDSTEKKDTEGMIDAEMRIKQRAFCVW